MSFEPKAAVDTAWVFKQFLFEDVLRDLDDHFQRLNIDYMPIKGAYLICAGLARQIRSRTMSDVDILVRERDFDAVVSHFRSIPNARIAEGSWPINKKGWPFEVTFLVPYKGRIFNIDFHKLVNLCQRFILPTEHLFARGMHRGHRTLPCAEDALIICLCHGLSHAGHFFSDALFGDVELLTNTSMDWARFWDIADSTGVAAFIYYVLKRFERKGKIPSFLVPKKTIKFTYADFLLLLTRKCGIGSLPPFLGRLLMELPLCHDPIGLVLNKFARCGGNWKTKNQCLKR
jgi:hypothetical protein